MAFTVTEIFDGGRKMRIDTALVRTYTRRFQVYCDVMNADPNEVWFYSGIPTLYAYYSTSRVTDLGAIIVGYEVEQDSNDPFNWFVTVEYSSKGLDPAQQTGGQGSGSDGTHPPNENPFLDPPQVSWANVADKQIIEEDRSDTPVPIQNSAGQPFAPRPTVDRSRLRLTFTRNEPAFDEVGMWAYAQKVNAGQYRSWDAGCVKIDSIIGQRSFKNNIPFWVVTYVLDFNPDGWDLELRNCGSMFKNADGKLVPAMQSGMGLTQVDLHATTGNALAVGADPNYKTFRAYVRVNFAPLGLNF